MTDTTFTHEDRRILYELRDAIVGTLQDDGLRVIVKQVRTDLTEHVNWNHEDAKEIATGAATAAATAAVAAHEQLRPHAVRREGWRRFFWGSAQMMVAGIGTTVFVAIITFVIWLGPLIEVLRKLAQGHG